MSLIAKAKTRTLIPADSYLARCYAVVDFGTQTSTFSGKSRDRQRIYIAWEIPELRIDIERDGRTLNMPKVKGRQFTLSLHKKATLRGVLDLWRGKPFTEEELDAFDTGKLVGAPAFLTIAHERSDTDGEVYDNIASILRVPKGMTAPAAETPTLMFQLPTEAPVTFPTNMPQWMIDTVKKSKEYRGWYGGETGADVALTEALMPGAFDPNDPNSTPF